MSRVYVCDCGRRTTDPFVIGGELLCVICAEIVRPDIVDSRERSNLNKFGSRRKYSAGFDGHAYDFREHSR